MSSSVNGTKISLTRGDTFRAVVTLTRRDGTTYSPTAGDVIRFAMKKNYEDASVLIEKTIPYDTLLLELEPEDTKPLAFGEYVYDVQITMEDGTVDTFIPTSILKLTKEVV